MPGAPHDFSHVFLDLDGTLTDPAPGITGCIRHALAKLNVPAPPAADLHWCIGPPLRDSLATLLDGRADPDEALALYRERFAETGLYENRMYDGIPAALTQLRTDGRQLYLATSKPRPYAVHILEYFGLAACFDGLFGAELDGTRADKGDLLAHALAETGAAPDRSMMIGDRRHDIDGARRNGMTAAGVLYGYGTRDELLAAGADMLIAAPRDIVAALSDYTPRKARGGSLTARSK